MNMLPIVEVDIPEQAIMACPAVGFKPRRAKVCAECPHFQGIGQMSHEGAWHKQFAIRCAHVIERRTQIVDVIEE